MYVECRTVAAAALASRRDALPPPAPRLSLVPCLLRGLRQPEEVYYTCAWSVDGRSGDPLLAIGGLRGVIKIINCVSQTVVRVRVCVCVSVCARWEKLGGG
jgi:hypothetical protein